MGGADGDGADGDVDADGLMDDGGDDIGVWADGVGDGGVCDDGGSGSVRGDDGGSGSVRGDELVAGVGGAALVGGATVEGAGPSRVGDGADTVEESGGNQT